MCWVMLIALLVLDEHRFVSKMKELNEVSLAD